jgi:16S rRNA G966 N2-methylase RsmD
MPGSAEQVEKTWEKVIDYLGISLVNDIRVVLESQQKVIFADPPYPAGNPGMIAAVKAKKKAQFQRLKKAWVAKIAEINNDDTIRDTADGQIAIAELVNKIELAE